MAKMQVPVTKAKTTLEVDTDDLPVEVYTEAMALGLKVLMNRGTSKITKANHPDPEELKAVALETAEKQLALMKSGDIKFSSGAKKSKVSGAVMTEARRIARNQVKDALKREGVKVSYIAAKDITAAANELLAGEDGPAIIAKATEALEDRAKTPVKINVKAIPIDAKKKAAAEAAALKKKASVSATQAGRVQAQARGEVRTSRGH